MRRVFSKPNIMPPQAVLMKLISVLLVALIVPIIAGCNKAEAPPAKVVPAVRTFKASMTSTTAARENRYSAIIAPSVQTDVSFRAGGYVNFILKVRDLDGRLRTVQEGDYVRKGTTLASVKQADYEAKVQEQQAAMEETSQTEKRLLASLAEGKAGFDQSKQEFERASRLYEKQALTRPEFEDATTKLQINDARVREAEAQISVNQATAKRIRASLNQTRFAAQDTSLRAPLDGIVLKRNIEEGSLVGSGTVAFTLADASTLKVAFGVPDVKLVGMHLGDKVSVTLEAIPNRVFQGKVTDIAPAADPRSRVFNVEVSLPNSDRRLKIGMVASLVTEQIATRAQLVVPLNSVVRSSSDPNGFEVFITEKQGDKTIVQERQVKVGDATGPMIAILQGLQEGDEVVTDGSTRVTQGQEIRVLN